MEIDHGEYSLQSKNILLFCNIEILSKIREDGKNYLYYFVRSFPQRRVNSWHVCAFTVWTLRQKILDRARSISLLLDRQNLFLFFVENAEARCSTQFDLHN